MLDFNKPLLPKNMSIESIKSQNLSLFSMLREQWERKIELFLFFMHIISRAKIKTAIQNVSSFGWIFKYLHCSNIAPPSATGADIAYKKWGIVVGTTLAEMCQTTAVSQRTLLWFCGSVYVCAGGARRVQRPTFVCTISKSTLCAYDNNLVGHVCSGNDTLVNDHNQRVDSPKIKFVNKHSSISVAVSEWERE